MEMKAEQSRTLHASAVFNPPLSVFQMAIVDRPSCETPLPAEQAPVEVRVARQDLTIYVESPPLLQAMVAAIRGAQHRVWLESYIICNDEAGRAIADALIERAKIGVDVRVIYDAIGSFGTPSAYFARLTGAGVQVHAFRSIRAAFGRWRFLRFLNRRNHRKLLVIDDREAFFGGMNICESREAALATQGAALPSLGWRDVHLRLVGERQAELAGEFSRLWNWCHRQRPPLRPPWRMKRLLATLDDTIVFFASWPARRRRRIEQVFAPLLRTAKQEVLLSIAYFLPFGRVLRELLRAKRRGVNIRVVVPGNSDVKLVQWATRHFARRLLARGIRIYERQDHMLHSKAMVVDGQWTVVGSANLDARSLRMNLELVGIVRSRELAAAVSEICRHEIACSRRLRLADLRRRTWWERFRDRCAWSLRGWL